MAIAALMGVGTAVKGEEVPSLDLNFDGQASSGTGDNHFDDVTLLLDGSSTTTDLSGNNTPTPDGDAQVISSTGPYGFTQSVLSLDGVGDAIEVTNHTGIDFANAWTFEGYFRASTVDTGTRALAAIWPTSGTARSFVLRREGASARNLRLYTSTDGSTISSTSTSGTEYFGNTDWHHVALVYNGTNAYKVYYDGALIITHSAGDCYQSSSPLNIGRKDNAPSNEWLGEMADVRWSSMQRYTGAFTPPSAKLPTAKEATSLDKLATDIVTQNKSGTVQSMYMGPNGKLVTGYRENLLTYSSIASWTQGTNMSVTASSVTDPLGGTGAYRIDDQDNVNWRSMDIAASVAANTWATLSVYIHASDNSSTMIGFNINYSGGVTLPRLTIVNGVPSTPSNHQTGHSSYTGTVTQVAGTDWYRWEIPFDFGVTSISFYPAMATASSTGYATVFGAQLELGGAAFQLVQTSGATVAAQVPRVEYDSSGNALGLLVEEARTNYVLRSQALDNSVWVTPTISTVDANVHNAPDGTATADRVNVNTAGYIYQTASGLTQNTEYTASWFIKADSATAFVYGFYNQTGGAWITRTEYDPTTGEDFGNGWYRFSVNVTTPIGCTSIRVYPLRHDTGGASNAVTGADGSSYVWGLQIEAGAGPTSYIPTSGASATRAADDITLATSSFGLDKVYGTALIDATVASEAAGTAVGIFEMVTHPYKRNLMTYIDTAQANLYAQFSETNFTGNLIASGVTYPLDITATVRRDGATGGGAANGTLLSSVTIDTATTTPTALRLGYLDGSGTMNGHIRRFTYWPRAINDAQLSKFTNQ